MKFLFQPTLEIENIRIQALREEDFDQLFALASDPKVWEMHPNKDRYQRDVFQNYFNRAIESKGAFLILDKDTDEVMGSTRFYDFDENNKNIFIGYTFLGTKFWGKNINYKVKKLMLDYIFQFVDEVNFHVGKNNIRSIKAMEKLGAKRLLEIDVAYFGENSNTNILFQISKLY